MNKFRKWFFKFLTGYELVEYRDILDTALRAHNLGQRILDDSKATLDLASRVNDRAETLLERYEEVIANDGRRT